MKVLMMTDLEGVSGVVSFEDQGYASGKYYEQAKKLLTGEINAAVEGMLEADVTDILVVDGHGPGGVVFEELHPAARLLHGRPFPWKVLQEEIGPSCDVGIMIGQHAMMGAERGTLNHTQNSKTVEYYKLNGRCIGELGQFAYFCGGVGKPVIFVSGDDAACREAEELIDGVTTVAVKEGLSRNSAISCPPGEAHRRIREGIVRAFKKQRDRPVRPLTCPGPYVLEKRYLSREHADAAENRPLTKRIDAKTIQVCSDNILDIIWS